MLVHISLRWRKVARTCSKNHQDKENTVQEMFACASWESFTHDLGRLLQTEATDPSHKTWQHLNGWPHNCMNEKSWRIWTCFSACLIRKGRRLFGRSSSYEPNQRRTSPNCSVEYIMARAQLCGRTGHHVVIIVMAGGESNHVHVNQSDEYLTRSTLIIQKCASQCLC